MGWSARLSPDEVEHYEEQGFLVPSYRLPWPQVERLRAALDQLIADNPGIRPEKLVSPHLEHSAEGIRGNRAFMDIANDPAILDLVEEAIGPDIILWGCQVFCKPHSHGMKVPWHQDGQYWPIRPLATCTVWIALDPCTRENGCLRVIPGSQRRHELVRHQRLQRTDLVLDQEVDDPCFDASHAVDVELQPGQMVLFDVYMIHGSNPNRSDRRRAGLALRYMPATSHFNRELIKAGESTRTFVTNFAERPIWLVRGIDRCGRNDFTVGHNRPH
jgi:Phytanoyl-CoA dioxygenase (PhyH)